MTVHLDNTMIVGQKFFKKWGKLLLIYHSIEAAKARKKRRLLTQSKPAILVSLCGKNPQNNGSAVYENLAYFSSKIEAPFVKYVNVFTFAWAIDFLSQASLGLSNLPNRA